MRALALWLLAWVVALGSAGVAQAAPQVVRASSTALEFSLELDEACVCEASTLTIADPGPRCEQLCALPLARVGPNTKFERVFNGFVFPQPDTTLHLHVMTRSISYEPELAVSEQLQGVVADTKASVGLRSRGVSNPELPFDILEVGELLVARYLMLTPEGPILIYSVLGTVDLTIVTLRKLDAPADVAVDFGAALISTLRVSREVPLDLF